MKTYIGTKIIAAEPAIRMGHPTGAYSITAMSDKDACKTCEDLVESHGYTCEDGYKVRYADGYESWSPKDVFEAAYLEVTNNTGLKTNAPSVSQKMVDDFITDYQVTTMGDKCTVVRAVLRNGFEIVESSACVSAENYDEKLGAEICMEKVKDKVWFLLGFLLQTAVHGVATGLKDKATRMTFGQAIEAMKAEDWGIVE